MKVSHHWLQTYFKDKLPAAEKLAELFTFHAFEVEGMEHINGDDILDVKILPDRANYALSHRGIAREIYAITGLPITIPAVLETPATHSETLKISVEDPTLCRRYIGRFVEQINVGPSPAWLKEKLEAIGQRSINNIVDATNFIMMDIGQPLHAFDAAKVIGNLIVRKASAGEMITTLDGKDVKLEDWMLVIADEDGPLAIAGVKGGNRAAVTANTTRIILESANFEPSSVRKTSTKVGIRNDSSKRFENDLSPVFAEEGMHRISALIKELSPDAVFGEIIDMYGEPYKAWEPARVSITHHYISDLLGVAVPGTELTDILQRLDIRIRKEGKELILDIPYWRLDLKISQDIAEEVGRIYGYDKIMPALPLEAQTQTINKVFYWSEKIKDLLVEIGYSEVYTYVLTDHGDIEIQNPLASDKGFLRKNLKEGIEKALIFNSRNAPLLGLDEVKIFEVGNIFTKEKLNNEHLSLSIGYFNTKTIKNKEKKSFELLEQLVADLGTKLGVEIKGVIESSEAGVIFETDLTALIEKLELPGGMDIAVPKITNMYKPFSVYPFSTRDIAVFVPEGKTEKDILDIILKEAGNLLVRYSLFDVFKKELSDGTHKISFAFRLVFQAFDRTLTDDDINPIMQKITDLLNGREGWQVR